MNNLGEKLRRTISLERLINLDLSMYPSFVSSLFKRLGHNAWLKILGHGKGTKIMIEDNTLICEGFCDESNLLEWSGLWFDPLDHINELNGLNSNIRAKLIKLIECFNDLRLIVSSSDKEKIILATFLSRRTDYHTNVIKWVQGILSVKDELKELSEKDISRIGRSYQLRQLLEVITELMNKLHSYKERDPWSLRLELLKVKYVGPKVVDSFLLFSGYGTYFTASDVHYARFIKMLGLKPLMRAIVPNKSMCLRFKANCLKCPYKSLCLTGLSIYLFGKLSGYIQTIAYVVDKAIKDPKIPSDIKAKVIKCIKELPT